VGAGRLVVYQLTVPIAEQIGVSALGRLLTPAEQEQRVLAYVAAQGRIGRRECQQVCGLSATQASRLLARLAQSGKIRPVGAGRSRVYTASG
jgi:predicted HTH transcriptional regulator